MKKIFAVISAVLLLLSIFPVGSYAQPAPRLVVSSAEAVPGETVDITISVENNPGVVAMGFYVHYDETVMSLTSVTDAGILGSALHSPNLANDPYYLKWENYTATSNFTANGTLVTLSFKIADNAKQGEYLISLSYEQGNSEIINVDLDDVDFLLTGGLLSVVACRHTHIEEVAGKDATCGEAGLSSGQRCVDCGEWIVAQITIPPTGEHTYGEWTVTTEPSEESEGRQTRVCSVCGNTESVILPKLAHEFSLLRYDETDHWYECANGCGAVSGKEAHSGGTATCAEKAKCSVCGAEYGETAAHSFTILKSDGEYHWYECANGCGAVSGKEAHSGGTATCTDKAKCAVCGTEYGEALGHSYTVLKSDGEYHWYECANGCGTISGKEAHAGGTATCTDKAKCAVCGTEYGEALGHSYTVLKSDGEYHWYECANGCGAVSGKEAHSGGTATCAEKAKCSVCGAEYGETAAHSFTVLKSDGEYHWYECANGCGAVSGKEAHSGGTATCAEKAKCSVCGAEYGETAAHSFTVMKNDGEYHWYECANGCGTVSGKEAHSGGAATCAKKAKCSVCGTEYGDTAAHSLTVPKHDGTGHWYECKFGCGTKTEISKHNWDKGTVTKKATCGEDGKRQYTCTVCGETKTEKIPATGKHSYGSWTVTKEATTSAPGEKTRTCSVCGKVEKEEIPQLEVVYTEPAVIAEAEFDEDGLLNVTVFLVNCKGLMSGTFDLKYNSDVLHLIKTSNLSAGIIGKDAATTDINVVANVNTPGTIKCYLWFFDSCEKDTPFELVTYIFEVSENAPQNTDITIEAYDMSMEKANGTTCIRIDLKNKTFRAIDVSDLPFLLGDVDGNGAVATADARLALRAAIGLEKYKAGAREFLAADVNKNGAIGTDDARFILRHAIGLKDPQIKW